VGPASFEHTILVFDTEKPDVPSEFVSESRLRILCRPESNCLPVDILSAPPQAFLLSSEGAIARVPEAQQTLAEFVHQVNKEQR